MKIFPEHHQYWIRKQNLIDGKKAVLRLSIFLVEFIISNFCNYQIIIDVLKRKIEKYLYTSNQSHNNEPLLEVRTAEQRMKYRKKLRDMLV